MRIKVENMSGSIEISRDEDERNLEDMLKDMELIIRACGFEIKGELGIIENEKE
jgi:hypothetical protein